MAAQAGIFPPARPAAGLFASARRSLAGHRVGPGRAAHGLPEAPRACGLGAVSRALSRAALAAAGGHAAVSLYVSAHSLLGAAALGRFRSCRAAGEQSA